MALGDRDDKVTGGDEIVGFDERLRALEQWRRVVHCTAQEQTAAEAAAGGHREWIAGSLGDGMGLAGKGKRLTWLPGHDRDE